MRHGAGVGVGMMRGRGLPFIENKKICLLIGFLASWFVGLLGSWFLGAQFLLCVGFSCVWFLGLLD